MANPKGGGFVTQERLNGANSKMLERIMGTNIGDEDRFVTSHFDLVKDVRVRRLKWTGDILHIDVH